MKKNMRAGWGAKEEQENKPGERMSCSLKKDLATPMEVLAPAGSMESLRAAVRCGADAVYLGGIQFSARANAQNFGEEELREAVRYCHGRGVKVYLALNTLLLEEELPKAVEAAAFAASLPVDAILVQDMGLLRLLKRLTPGLPLHASTQMSIHTPAGARALWEAGCSRVVTFPGNVSFGDRGGFKGCSGGTGSLCAWGFVHVCFRPMLYELCAGRAERKSGPLCPALPPAFFL